MFLSSIVRPSLQAGMARFGCAKIHNRIYPVIYFRFHHVKIWVVCKKSRKLSKWLRLQFWNFLQFAMSLIPQRKQRPENDGDSLKPGYKCWPKPKSISSIGPFDTCKSRCQINEVLVLHWVEKLVGVKFNLSLNFTKYYATINFWLTKNFKNISEHVWKYKKHKRMQVCKEFGLIVHQDTSESPRTSWPQKNEWSNRMNCKKILVTTYCLQVF